MIGGLRARLGLLSDSPVDGILSEINDPKGVIDDGFRETARRLHDKIQKERQEQEVKPYTSAQAAIFLQALTNAANFHHGQLRKNKETYFDGHLVPTVENLLGYAGITGPPTLSAGLLHDAHEDQNIPLETLLPAAQIRNLLERFAVAGPDEDLEPSWIDTQVQRMVDGMSKMKGLVNATREEVRAATFFHLLEIARDSGPRVIIVKGAGDRISNLPTLNIKSESSKARSLDETEQNYIDEQDFFEFEQN